MRTSITPGEVWLDTKGERIHAHGGSIIEVDDRFYWYGEDKERTAPGNGIWHWGVRAYSSTDLYNWVDEGTIVSPVLDDESSPLHPAQMMDRPHIIADPARSRFVCWVKVMDPDGTTQRTTILTAPSFTGPYTIAREWMKPLGMCAGDFDLVVDPRDGKGYYYFERPHTELICADLTEDYLDVSGHYSTHFPLVRPPAVREAPAYFTRRGLHYLVTSGTTSYFPNPSELASAPTYHGPWTVLGDPHPTDEGRTSFRSQISSVFRHPYKRDLYIALADRWLPNYTESSEQALRIFDQIFGPVPVEMDPLPTLAEPNTSLADYVWLPFRFDGDMGYLDWHDEWRIEDFD